jgi:hypothetical protein
MSNENEVQGPQEEAPNKSSVGFAVAFFLIPLLVLITFGVLSKKA